MVAWPPGVSAETARTQKDYPPQLWQQAVMRWNQLGKAKQEEEKLQRTLLAMKLRELSAKPDIGEVFSPWDLLWFGLAIVTAYKIGVGTYGSD